MDDQYVMTLIRLPAMQILFRKSFDHEDELAIARLYCAVREHRSDCDANEVVVGRYSVLPYYEELEKDLKKIGSRLINSYNEHRWIADFRYYDYLTRFTFETWGEEEYAKSKYDGPVVVKGRTNSRKHRWDTMMFANDPNEARYIADLLYADPMFAEQGIIYRKYVPLQTYEIGINGQPFTNEWRFFFLRNKMLTHGYYWSQAEDAEKHIIEPECVAFAQQIAEIAQYHVNFFVVDVAKTQSGDWMLVELNDGQMSGLCMCEPRQLYNGLKNEFSQLFRSV